jgi:hypothetical protein
MRTLPAREVFSRDDAKALGWTDSSITRALRTGRLVALRRGQLTGARAPGEDRYLEHDRSLILAARAAARTRRGSVVSHHAAALIHGLPLLERSPELPALTVAPRSADGAVGARLHRATLTEDEVVYVGDLPVTSVARTLVDLGRWAPTPSAVVTIDAALHLHHVTLEAIEAVLLRCWNWPRIRRAIRAVELANARSESPLESVSRLVLHRLRLPAPRLQQEIVGADGIFIGRVDFYWDEFGVVGEADGAGKYDRSLTALIEEKRRQEQLEDRNVVVTRWGWAQTRQPSELRRLVTKAFDRAVTRSRSGLPREWSFR